MKINLEKIAKYMGYRTAKQMKEDLFWFLILPALALLYVLLKVLEL